MDGISGLSAPSGALCVDFPTCKDGAAEGWPWFHIRVYRAGKACLHAGPVPRQEQLAAADSCKPLALINRDCCQQDEGWDAGRAVIGLGLRMEGGIWCCCAPPCNIWRGSSFEVGTQWPSRSEPSLWAFSMSFIHVDKDSDFPLQNLPYGVFSTREEVSDSTCCPWAVVMVWILWIGETPSDVG